MRKKGMRAAIITGDLSKVKEIIQAKTTNINEALSEGSALIRS